VNRPGHDFRINAAPDAPEIRWPGSACTGREFD
jgi:hypothetical protein